MRWATYPRSARYGSFTRATSGNCTFPFSTALVKVEKKNIGGLGAVEAAVALEAEAKATRGFGAIPVMDIQIHDCHTRPVHSSCVRRADCHIA